MAWGIDLHVDWTDELVLALLFKCFTAAETARRLYFSSNSGLKSDER